ncbi:hypothetical protein LWI29_012676 [Acer saccharum]|uniref:Uncharacterized protein n=1 Tax=Acer saccharum TaxID=4024 RepID=A0AA39T5H0_ACESA|nr:hypothetical protein LWI29_012676 [Acer saccharum]
MSNDKYGEGKENKSNPAVSSKRKDGDDNGNRNRRSTKDDSVKKAKQNELVAATLIATVTFTAGFTVLPVMKMGAFIPGLRRKYPVHEYISALLLVVGLILFTLADAQTSPNFSIIGVLMILGALVMDSFLDGDAVLLYCSRVAFLARAYDSNRRASFLLPGIHVHK